MLCSVFIIYLFYSLFYKEEYTYDDKIRLILSFKPDEDNSFKIRDKDMLLVPDYDCFSNYEVDYSDEKNTILYINNRQEIIEKNIETGLSYKPDYSKSIEDLLNIKRSSKSEGYAISNVQYGPGTDEISFIFNNNIYVYNISSNKVLKKTSCSTYMYFYKWKNQSELYTVNLYNKHGGSGVFLWQEGEEEVLVAENIVYFTFSDKRDYLYCIREKWYDKDITIQIEYEIIELNLSSGMTKKLVEIGTNNYFMLKCIDNQFLIYVDGNYNKKRYKIYSYDLVNGRKQYMRETKEMVIGILKN